MRRFRVFFFESALAWISILVFGSFLTTDVLEFVDEVEDGFVVSIEAPSDLSGAQIASP